MARRKIMIDTYGIDPPQKSTPYWGMTYYPTEDDIVASIDFQASLQRLTPTEREIILLCNQGYQKREIAEMINLPETTTHDIKQRAIAKLKEMMNGKDSIHCFKGEEL